jgi:hypothetical protein
MNETPFQDISKGFQYVSNGSEFIAGKANSIETEENKVLISTPCRDREQSY